MCVRVLLDYVEDVAGIKDTEIRPDGYSVMHTNNQALPRNITRGANVSLLGNTSSRTVIESCNLVLYI